MDRNHYFSSNTFYPTSLPNNNNLDYSYENKITHNSAFAGNLESNKEDKLYSLRYENKELNEIVYREQLKNQDLTRIMDLQTRDLEDMDRRYSSISNEYQIMLEKYRQSETRRLEQDKRIHALQEELDKLREKMIKNSKKEEENIKGEEDNPTRSNKKGKNTDLSIGKTGSSNTTSNSKKTSSNSFAKNNKPRNLSQDKFKNPTKQTKTEGSERKKPSNKK